MGGFAYGLGRTLRGITDPPEADYLGAGLGPIFTRPAAFIEGLRAGYRGEPAQGGAGPVGSGPDLNTLVGRGILQQTQEPPSEPGSIPYYIRRPAGVTSPFDYTTPPMVQAVINGRTYDYARGGSGASAAGQDPMMYRGVDETTGLSGAASLARVPGRGDDIALAAARRAMNFPGAGGAYSMSEESPMLREARGRFEAEENARVAEAYARAARARALEQDPFRVEQIPGEAAVAAATAKANADARSMPNVAGSQATLSELIEDYQRKKREIPAMPWPAEIKAARMAQLEADFQVASAPHRKAIGMSDEQWMMITAG